MNAVLQAQPSIQRNAIGLFLLVGAFTGFWLGLNVVLPGLNGSGIPSVGTRPLTRSVVGLVEGAWQSRQFRRWFTWTSDRV